MIPVRGDVRVWLASGVTDMRRGMNTLALQVQEALGRDPHAGDLFVFRGRRGDLVTLCITPLDSGPSQRLNILSFREVSYASGEGRLVRRPMIFESLII